MAGIYGSHPEDRYFERQLNRHLDAQAAADAAAELIDQRARDIFRAKVACLPVAYIRVAGQFCGLGDALRELDDAVLHDLAEAVRDNKPEAAGREIIRLVIGQLRQEAQDEAENE